METNAQIQARLAKQNKPSSKKTNSKTSTPTEDNADTLNNPPQGTVSASNSLTGLPIGTPIKAVPGRTEPGATTYPAVKIPAVFGTIQYTKDAPYKIIATMGNQEKANLLASMARIPGLYSAGQVPTDNFITSQGPALSFRQIDYDALTKLMIHADLTGQDYTKSVADFRNNPTVAAQYFGKVSETPKKVRLTSTAALVADIDSKFQDLFEIPVDKKMAVAYAKEFNKAELAAGGAGLTETQQKNIFNKYVEQTALARFKTVKATPGTEDDAQLEQGALGKLMRTFRGAYSDNGMAVSERQIYKDALAGMQSTAAFNNKMESINLHASTAFPALKDWVAKGNTVKQYLDGGGFTESYAKIYGVPVGTVTPDKFANVFAGPVPLTVQDWEATQWKDPKIKQTQFYQDTKKNDLRAMADAFGIKV
jgi:hypothetical protein